MYFKKKTLIGFFNRDAEAPTAMDGARYIVLTLATKDSWKDQSGEWHSHTEWHRCIVWGTKFAEFAVGLKKGAYLQVEGELRSREYLKDGVTHRVHEIRTAS